METAVPEKYKKSEIIDAISKTMRCEECPYPCKARTNSSLANCQYHWYQILSWIDSDTPWVNGVREELHDLFKRRIFEEGGQSKEHA